MKKNMFAVILTLSLGAISYSCSSQYGDDGDKVLKTLKKELRYRENVHEFSEVKLVRNITAEDSLNFSLGDQKYLDEIIARHANLNEQIKHRLANPNHVAYNYTGAKTNEDVIAEINRYADGFDGKFDDVDWRDRSFYKRIYRLKNLPKDQVLAKIYKVTYKRKQDSEWSTDIWVLDPNLDGTIDGRIDEEMAMPTPKSNFDMERLHFKHYIKQ